METVTYEQIKNLLETHCKDCKCVVAAKIDHVFEDATKHVDKKIYRESFKLVLKGKCFDNFKYLYSHIVFTYFDHNDCLCKVDKKVIFDKYLSKDESYSLNKTLRDIKEKSFIADKSTSIVYEGCSIFEETDAEIAKFISAFSEGAKLDDIFDKYNKNNLWFFNKNE